MIEILLEFLCMGKDDGHSDPTAPQKGSRVDNIDVQIHVYCIVSNKPEVTTPTIYSNITVINLR